MLDICNVNKFFFTFLLHRDKINLLASLKFVFK